MVESGEPLRILGKSGDGDVDGLVHGPEGQSAACQYVEDVGDGSDEQMERGNGYAHGLVYGPEEQSADTDVRRARGLEVVDVHMYLCGLLSYDLWIS